MDKKSKFITEPRSGSSLTLEERHQMVLEYLRSNQTKYEIWKKYTGQDSEHGKILLWLRQFGYQDKRKGCSFAVQKARMNHTRKTLVKKKEVDFEKLQLKNRIAQLEKQLEEAEMKAIAFSTMVDVAEETFKIPIRKKFNTKP
ncbi:MAG: hypothetical protein LBU83_03780 [Bacteroidales bacterium]|jgi:hypothetical protein|nr:hypothetical protein [Bacteroidales bacterium]